LGTLQGDFFGPDADEVGGTFELGAAGNSLTGAFTGQQLHFYATSDDLKNLSLLNTWEDEMVRGREAYTHWQTTNGVSGFSSVSSGSNRQTHVNYSASGIESVFGYTIDQADLTESNDRFDIYETVLNGDQATIEIYKLGGANSEIALTYTNLAILRTSTPAGGSVDYQDLHIYYGIPTNPGVIQARQGTAQYAGVAYGTGASPNGTLYDVSGDIALEIDFSGGSYSGDLSLVGQTTVDTVDFGSWGFAGAEQFGGLVGSALSPLNGQQGNGNIQAEFFGPAGEEIGASFDLLFGDVNTTDFVELSGVALAKEQ
jgi:hypothetical protein